MAVCLEIIEPYEFISQTVRLRPWEVIGLLRVSESSKPWTRAHVSCLPTDCTTLLGALLLVPPVPHSQSWTGALGEQPQAWTLALGPGKKPPRPWRGSNSTCLFSGYPSPFTLLLPQGAPILSHSWNFLPLNPFWHSQSIPSEAWRRSYLQLSVSV